MIFTPSELRMMTLYTHKHKQLEVLHRRGFFRARIERRNGVDVVILERAHYEAVCAAQAQKANEPRVARVS